MVKAIYFYMLQ